MKFFIDTAFVKEIEDCNDTGLIDGVTTNPSLIAKSGRDPYDVYKELADMGIPDISMEVMGTKQQMHDQAKILYSEFRSVTTIKLPMTVDGLAVCKDLSSVGIRTNVTLIFNAAQALLAAKAGATYVSPFVGRIDDQGYAGLEVVRSIASLYKMNGFQTEVLAASIRTPHRVVRSFYNGADVVTMPPKVFWGMYKHILTTDGLRIFEEDATKIDNSSTD